MTENLLYFGFLVLLLTLLLASWILPLGRRGIEEELWFRGMSAVANTAAGVTLLGFAVINPKPDIFLVIRILAGFSLLYTGAGMIMRLYQDSRLSSSGETGME